jgi:hypothetical protein
VDLIEYVSRHGHDFVDRALYLPKSWDKPRRIAGTAANITKNLQPSD